MSRVHICPLCRDIQCYSSYLSANNAIRFDCKKFHRSLTIDPSLENCYSDVQKHCYYALIFEHVMQNPRINEPFWHYQLGEVQPDSQFSVNVQNLHSPNTFAQRAERILLNLIRINPDYGAEIPASGESMESAFFLLKPEPFAVTFGIAMVMCDTDYLSISRPGFVSISSKGWQKIDELSQKQNGSQCFVAMAFKEETRSIREAIRVGAGKCGYHAMLIDEKEHNNQIVPEILYEIDRSSFLVMDVTVPNYGAYYEAGYALGKGKQVIITCRKDAFENKDKAQRPHFDVQQKSMIVWGDEDDLIRRLGKRIEATIGLANVV